MKLELTIHPDKCYADYAGEALMDYLNPDSRWGYMTHDFKCPVVGEDLPVDINSELIEATICCGCYAKIEYKNISKNIVGDGDLVVYLHWDGDGTIVFKHLKEGWMLYNSDMKKSYDWKWVEEDSWVYKLPESYYDDQA